MALERDNLVPVKHMDPCGCGARSQYVVSAGGQDKSMTDKLAHCYGKVNVWADLDLIGHVFQIEDQLRHQERNSRPNRRSDTGIRLKNNIVPETEVCTLIFNVNLT
jgi:hypothetical protein